LKLASGQDDPLKHEHKHKSALSLCFPAPEVFSMRKEIVTTRKGCC
jgi:hypothetical protein